MSGPPGTAPHSANGTPSPLGTARRALQPSTAAATHRIAASHPPTAPHRIHRTAPPVTRQTRREATAQPLAATHCTSRATALHRTTPHGHRTAPGTAAGVGYSTRPEQPHRTALSGPPAPHSPHRQRTAPPHRHSVQLTAPHRGSADSTRQTEHRTETETEHSPAFGSTRPPRLHRPPPRHRTPYSRTALRIAAPHRSGNRHRNSHDTTCTGTAQRIGPPGTVPVSRCFVHRAGRTISTKVTVTH